MRHGPSRGKTAVDRGYRLSATLIQNKPSGYGSQRQESGDPFRNLWRSTAHPNDHSQPFVGDMGGRARCGGRGRAIHCPPLSWLTMKMWGIQHTSNFYFLFCLLRSLSTRRRKRDSDALCRLLWLAGLTCLVGCAMRLFSSLLFGLGNQRWAHSISSR